MKFNQYIFNNLTQKKVRTILCIIGIATSLVSSTVMALLTDYYSSRTSTFFRPFPEFDEVLERGTNFIQLIPVGSTIDLEVKSDLDTYFNIDSIPLLIVPNNKDLLSFIIIIFMVFLFTTANIISEYLSSNGTLATKFERNSSWK